MKIQRDSVRVKNQFVVRPDLMGLDFTPIGKRACIAYPAKERARRLRGVCAG